MNINELHNLATHIYHEDEIKNYKLFEAINNNPLSELSSSLNRSKLAYKEIFNNVNPSKNYLFPGQFVIFKYAMPKFKDDLEFYDAIPFLLTFGTFRTNSGNIRELGFNLHLYPPSIRKSIINTIYDRFKSHYSKYFNEPSNTSFSPMSYQLVRHIISSSKKIEFGVREYIPSRRGDTYIIPTRLLNIANFTEGMFNKLTREEVMKFWRNA